MKGKVWACVPGAALLLFGCVLAGAGRGVQGGSGAGGKAEVIFGKTEIHQHAQQQSTLERCRDELKAQGIEYSPKAFLHKVEAGELAAVRKFLACGMDPNTEIRYDKHFVGTTWSALCLAAWEGHDAVVEALLDGGAAIRRQSGTPLTCVTSSWGGGFGRVSTARLLLRRGADVRASNKGGMTPLEKAASAGQIEILKVFLQAGAPVTGPDAARALEDSVKSHGCGNPKVVQFLLEAGVPVGAHYPPLAVALGRAKYTPGDSCTQDGLRIACLLVRFGARPEPPEEGDILTGRCDGDKK